ncbi:MAG TPA: tetratricopeptide repeat protein [Fimbriiglobus sp.]|nr:tetratricopeptide repeat protein [Fimbriiglobus sp.]
MISLRLRTLVAAATLLAGLTIGISPAADDGTLKEAALKLNDLKDSDAAKEKLIDLLKDKEAAKKLVRVAAEVQKGAKDDKPFKFTAALTLAQLAHILKAYEPAELFYETAVNLATKAKDGKEMADAYAGWWDLYWDQKKYDTVEAVARKALDAHGGRAFENFKPMVLEKLVQAKAKQGDTDEALRMTEGLVQLDKGGWYFLQLKGWVLREAGKIDDAITTYEDVLDRLDDAKELKDETRTRIKRNVRYLLSGLHVDNKDVDKAAKQLQMLIKDKDDPNQATYHNDLGFIWADNGKNLAESEKLIREALALDAKDRKKTLADPEKLKDLTADDIQRLKKENAAYLDSLGWVLFKQGKYEEALKYLKQAADDPEVGHHIEIWDHWADALVALDRKKEAVGVWQKALKFEDTSPRDRVRRKEVTRKMNKVKDELEKK